VPGVGDGARETRLARLRERALRVDGDPRLVGALRAVRRRLPGDDRLGDGLSLRGERPVDVVARNMSALTEGRRSAAHEAGLGALQVWQAVSERAGRGRGEADVAILFTDLVGFSSWALEAGDEPAVELLRTVARATERAVAAQDGRVVKQLGDGAMAVFAEPHEAALAALDALDRLEAVEVGGHRPLLRAGVHHGRPRTLGGDFLGVDVNVAARVMEAAKGGRLLASERTAAALDGETFEVGRARRLKAPGAPADLRVCEVRRRATL
jgi:adenylate cyclase